MTSHDEPRRAVTSRGEHSFGDRTEEGPATRPARTWCPQERDPHHQPYPRLVLGARQTTVAAVGPKGVRMVGGASWGCGGCAWACPGKSSCGGQMGQWRATLGPGHPTPGFWLGPKGTGPGHSRGAASSAPHVVD